MINWNVEIIPNFTLKEARCKCNCGLIMLQITTLDFLHKVRNEYGKSIIVTSWTRCKDWNAKVGGTATSYHMNGRAVDIKPQDSDDIDLLATIAEKHFGYVKQYDGGWVHVDVRGERP